MSCALVDITYFTWPEGTVQARGRCQCGRWGGGRTAADDLLALIALTAVYDEHARNPRH